MTKEQAVEQMERKARSTQQSSELGSQSLVQQGNEWMKLFTMFTSSQRQYLQMMTLATEARAAGRMDNATYTKTMIIFGVALPVLFQAVSQGGMDDEEDFKNALKAVLQTPISSTPVVGQISNYALSSLINGHTYGRGAGGLPVFSSVESFVKGANKITMDDISLRETIVAMRDMMALAEIKGIPGRQLGNVALGIHDTMAGDAVQGALEAGGMSPYQAKRVTK
jgi:hypothetical protein